MAVDKVNEAEKVEYIAKCRLEKLQNNDSL